MDTSKEGSILVGNQRMEIMEDVITKAMALGIDGINFYRDRKVSDKAVTEFAVTAKERK
jgi:hypothetical protein